MADDAPALSDVAPAPAPAPSMSETKSEVDVSSVLVPAEVPTPDAGRERGVTFWMVFVSTLLVDMLSAIDLVSTFSPFDSKY